MNACLKGKDTRSGLVLPATNYDSEARTSHRPHQLYTMAVSGGPSSVTELPDTTLQSICSFLPPTSQLLFAVGVSGTVFSSNTPPPKIWKPSAAVKAITSESIHRSTINFGDNDVTLVEKLGDDDLAGMLWCMDAVNNLRRLILTNCKGIEGYGLSPLYGSLVIQQIDLCINATNRSMRNESDISESLSMDAVLPILYSISDSEGNALKQIQLPKKWREEQNDALTDFVICHNKVRELEIECYCTNPS